MQTCAKIGESLNIETYYNMLGRGGGQIRVQNVFTERPGPLL